jgi:hypothetical protein
MSAFNPVTIDRIERAIHLHKNKRKATWYFTRRVPLRYQQLDPRGIVRHSTKIRISDDPKGKRARLIIRVRSNPQHIPSPF